MIDLSYFRKQRQHRQKKRKQLILRFERLKQYSSLRPEQQSPNISQEVPSSSSSSSSNQYEQLIALNLKYKHQLNALDQTGAEQILSLKDKLLQTKNDYKKQFEQLITFSQEEKMNKKVKIEEMFKQIKETIAKNKELRANNLEIQQFLLEDSQQRFQNINKQYLARQEDLKSRLLQSNELVDNFENQFSDQKVIDQALNNEQLVKAMIQEGQQQFQGPLLTQQSVQQLLTQKNEIIKLLGQNSKGKQDQITKMQQLAEAYKEAHTKINEERNMLIQSNTRIASELMKIKEIFKQILQSKENDEEDNESGQQNDENDQDEEN